MELTTEFNKNIITHERHFGMVPSNSISRSHPRCREQEKLDPRYSRQCESGQRLRYEIEDSIRLGSDTCSGCPSFLLPIWSNYRVRSTVRRCLYTTVAHMRVPAGPVAQLLLPGRCDLQRGARADLLDVDAWPLVGAVVGAAFRVFDSLRVELGREVNTWRLAL